MTLEEDEVKSSEGASIAEKGHPLALIVTRFGVLHRIFPMSDGRLVVCPSLLSSIGGGW